MSAIPSTGVTFDFTARDAGASKVAQDVQKQFTRTADVVNRLKMQPKFDLSAMRAEAEKAKQIIRGVQQEADRLSAQKSVGIGSGFGIMGGGGGGGGRIVGGGGVAGAAGAVGGGESIAAGLTSATRGIGRAVAAVAMVEGGIEVFRLGIDVVGAGIHAAVGDFKKANTILADAGDEAKKLPLIGNIARPLEKFLGFITGMNKQIETAEKDAKELDEKSERMAKRNQQMRGVNAGMEGIVSGEAQRRAGEFATPAQRELTDVRGRITALDASHKQNQGPGFDEAGFKSARAALVQRELELRSQAAGEVEMQEREHQAKLLEIRREAGVEQLRVIGHQEEAERDALINGLKRNDEALQLEMEKATNRGDTAGARRLQEQLNAQQAAQVNKLAAHDAAAEQKRLDREGQQDSDFEDRKARVLAEEDKRTAEGRERGRQSLIRDTENQIAELRHASRVTDAGVAVQNPTLTDFGRGADPHTKSQLDKMIELLRQLRDKDDVARVS